jgi:hypothetical protein
MLRRIKKGLERENTFPEGWKKEEMGCLKRYSELCNTFPEG